jgi:hypothetical protein
MLRPVGREAEPKLQKFLIKGESYSPTGGMTKKRSSNVAKYILYSKHDPYKLEIRPYKPIKNKLAFLAERPKMVLWKTKRP